MVDVKHKINSDTQVMQPDSDGVNDFQPQQDEISSWDGIEYIDNKKDLERIRKDQGPIVGDYAKDYEDMPEDTRDKE